MASGSKHANEAGLSAVSVGGSQNKQTREQRNAVGRATEEVNRDPR